MNQKGWQFHMLQANFINFLQIRNPRHIHFMHEWSRPIDFPCLANLVYWSLRYLLGGHQYQDIFVPLPNENKSSLNVVCLGILCINSCYMTMKNFLWRIIEVKLLLRDRDRDQCWNADLFFKKKRKINPRRANIVVKGLSLQSWGP